MTTQVLEARDIRAGYPSGGLALHGVDFLAGGNEDVCILGANGSGKTTLLRVLSGLLRPRSGTVMFDSASIANLKPDEICRRGVGHVVEGRALFGDMTVIENLKLGAFGRWRDIVGIQETLSMVYQTFPILAERRLQRANTLSGGQQQMLAVARALMAKPSVLLLDEPSLGLAPVAIDSLYSALDELRHELHLRLVIVEQQVERALKMTNRCYVLDRGRIAFAGESTEAETLELGETYLGN